jgi:hypothetical protein
VPPVNSFKPGALWVDDHGVPINAHGGGILFHDGVYYWFGEHKIEEHINNSNRIGVHLYSSKDLYNWKDAGIALRMSYDPRSDITQNCTIERPKVLFNKKTGKFVMWFHLELKGLGYRAARCAVAVSDTVTGPYRFIGSFRPNAGVWPRNITDKDKSDPYEAGVATSFAGGQWSRDMTLFQDDDGVAYQFYTSEGNNTMHVSRLTDDFLRPAGDYARILIREGQEGQAILKHKGKYYIISSGCKMWDPNPVTLWKADTVWGPYAEVGNAFVGPEDQLRIAFGSQPTFILPVQGKRDAYIYMGDRWVVKNGMDSRHVWLPIQFKDDQPFIAWMDSWNLGFFGRK